jgi:hypothetical protein
MRTKIKHTRRRWQIAAPYTIQPHQQGTQKEGTKPKAEEGERADTGNKEEKILRATC